MISEKLVKIADLDEDGQTFEVAEGGRGGLGNHKRRDVVETNPGQPGEDNEYELRLKMIADVGFIGFPNAGKSTLLASITRAFPKIAPYPFTTLRPYVGLTKFVDGSQLVFADLPGIIEGAHLNKGLGHRFLQHAERTKMLLYVIDGTFEDLEETGRNPLKDYRVLYNELKMYKEGMLLEKPSFIVVNKMDRQHTRYQDYYAALKEEVHCQIMPVSAREGDNLEVMVETIKEIVENER